MNRIRQKAWVRLRGIGQLAPAPRARAKAIAVWREKLARERDLPRAWIFSDAAMFSIAQANPGTAAALTAVQPLNDKFARTLLEALQSASSVVRTIWNRCRSRARLPSKKPCSIG